MGGYCASSPRTHGLSLSTRTQPSKADHKRTSSLSFLPPLIGLIGHVVIMRSARSQPVFYELRIFVLGGGKARMCQAGNLVWGGGVGDSVGGAPDSNISLVGRLASNPGLL